MDHDEIARARRACFMAPEDRIARARYASALERRGQPNKARRVLEGHALTDAREDRWQHTISAWRRLWRSSGAIQTPELWALSESGQRVSWLSPAPGARAVPRGAARRLTVCELESSAPPARLEAPGASVCLQFAGPELLLFDGSGLYSWSAKTPAQLTPRPSYEHAIDYVGRSRESIAVFSSESRALAWWPPKGADQPSTVTARVLRAYAESPLALCARASGALCFLPLGAPPSSVLRGTRPTVASRLVAADPRRPQALVEAKELSPPRGQPLWVHELIRPTSDPAAPLERARIDLGPDLAQSGLRGASVSFTRCGSALRLLDGGVPRRFELARAAFSSRELGNIGLRGRPAHPLATQNDQGPPEPEPERLGDWSPWHPGADIAAVRPRHASGLELRSCDGRNLLSLPRAALLGFSGDGRSMLVTRQLRRSDTALCALELWGARDA